MKLIKVILIQLLLIVVVLFVSASFGESLRGSDSFFQVDKQKPNSSIDEISCLKNGGVFKNICLDQKKVCVEIYKDAGKACSSSNDCDGECRTRGGFLKVDQVATGFCSADNAPCGCFQKIENGKAEAVFCSD